MLDAKQFASVRRILEKVDEGLPCPRIPGRLGQFIRQDAGGGRLLALALAESECGARRDGAISGHGIGEIELYSIVKPHVEVLSSTLGEVARTITVSEELGGVIQLTMWLKARAANTTYNILQRSAGVQIAGDFRWTPPSKLTTGESWVEHRETARKWCTAASVKGVADDLSREPHALEYVLDNFLGPPGLKHFRCVAALRRGMEWLVLPALERETKLDVASVRAGEVSRACTGDVFSLLIYREPWLPSWCIVDGVAIDGQDALSHALAWVDFQRELRGYQFDPRSAMSVRASLRRAGVETIDSRWRGRRRVLHPAARRVLRALRRLR